MMDQSRRAWLYCRIDAPEDEHGRLKGQQKELADYAEQMGFEVVGTSQDTGSGLRFDRNGLAEVREAAKAGKMDVLLIVSLSRLGRDAMKTWDFIDRLNRRGIKVYSPLEGEITTKMHDALSRQIFHASMRMDDLAEKEPGVTRVFDSPDNVGSGIIEADGRDMKIDV
ncbi:MAG: hypothetical protein A4E53_03705 [Pelotomaculum sp. PtaB.Bin104]|nr:MAG: hypothetical protein A4E53_03705 [Pelotomaculum sp. PtaB.Bin104]